MFDSSNLMMRLHHLYIIKTILEIQRKCNLWYTRLKYKFVFSLNRRLHSIGFPVLKYKCDMDLRGDNHHHGRPRNYHFVHEQRPTTVGENLTANGDSPGKFRGDFNEYFAQQANNWLQSSIAIPTIQMLLMPMIQTSPSQSSQQLQTSLLVSSSDCDQAHNNRAGRQNHLPTMISMPLASEKICYGPAMGAGAAQADRQWPMSFDYQSFVGQQAQSPPSPSQQQQQRLDRSNHERHRQANCDGIQANFARNFWSAAMVSGKQSLASNNARLLLRNPLLYS